MSYFANALRVALEANNVSQSALAEQSGISTGQMSKYVAGTNQPAASILERMCQVFPENDRIAIVIARLRDEIPASARALIHIRSRATNGTSTVMEDPEPKIVLPPDLRKAFDYLERAAVETPDVAESILAAYRILSSK